MNFAHESDICDERALFGVSIRALVARMRHNIGIHKIMHKFDGW